MQDYDPGYPTWRHRLKYGKVESQVFNSNEVPKGWHETVAQAMDVGTELKLQPAETIPKGDAPKRGRPRKVKHGDDSKASVQVSPPQDPVRERGSDGADSE